MKRTKVLIVLAGLILIGSAARAVLGIQPKEDLANLKKVEAIEDVFRQTVSSTASVQPENHIQVTPSVPGRVDRLMVEEGQRVKAGQILAWMSSSDRAALMDAARAQGGSALKEWNEAYQPTPILAPVSGRVIARHVVAGQTVSTETKLFEISDRLVIRAQIDETDVAKVKAGQTAQVRIDAFPGKSYPAKVAKIGHQSTLVNNISTYEVLLAGSGLPEEMRSGMTATVDFVLSEQERAVVLPVWVSGGIQNQDAELLVGDAAGLPQKRKVRFGGSNGERVQVLAGLKANETVFYKPIDISAAKDSPFGLFGGGKKKKEAN